MEFLCLTATTAPFSFWMTYAWQLWAELPHSVAFSCNEATCRTVFGSWNLNGFDSRVEPVNWSRNVHSPTLSHCIAALSLEHVNQRVIVRRFCRMALGPEPLIHLTILHWNILKRQCSDPEEICSFQSCHIPFAPSSRFNYNVSTTLIRNLVRKHDCCDCLTA